MLVPLNVLVVDDEPAVCTFMQLVLESGGNQVWTAHSGADALDMLLKDGHQVDLIVTDVLMPDLSGPMLAKAARQLMPGLPVLYVSGYCGDFGGQLPAAACLEKPFTAAELLERVHAVMAPVLAFIQ